DSKFSVRQKARRELEQIGELAAATLQKTLAETNSAEVRRAVQRILDGLGTRTPGAEELQSLRAVEALERSGAAEAKDVLRSIAAGAPGVGLTEDARAALERIEKRSKP